MPIRQPRYSKEEHARRGNEIYQTEIRSIVEKEHSGRIVAIDIETGAFELGDDVAAASENLLLICPDAQTWFIRVGHRGVYHFNYAHVSSVNSRNLLPRE